MVNTKYVQIYKENQDLYNDIIPLWFSYFNELHDGKSDDEKSKDDETILDLNRRISIQGRRSDMHFEIFYYGNVPIGFANFAIDTGGILGLIDKGFGFVMEFYISPEFRRKGYGKLFYNHIEKTLIDDGTQNVYLTSDTVTGVPFWVSMGFSESGKIDPDNKLPIYIKYLI